MLSSSSSYLQCYIAAAAASDLRAFTSLPNSAPIQRPNHNPTPFSTSVDPPLFSTATRFISCSRTSYLLTCTLYCSDLLTCTAVIESLGRSGNVEEALRFFDEMKARQIRPSLYVYRSLITNLKKMGKVDLALSLTEEMNSCDSELAGPMDFKRNKRL